MTPEQIERYIDIAVSRNEGIEVLRDLGFNQQKKKIGKWYVTDVFCQLTDQRRLIALPTDKESNTIFRKAQVNYLKSRQVPSAEAERLVQLLTEKPYGVEEAVLLWCSKHRHLSDRTLKRICQSDDPRTQARRCGLDVKMSRERLNVCLKVIMEFKNEKILKPISS